ncbi:MAG: hypothetical protein HC940_00315 [Acaryochloris sp. SU_5_25]|nr:hypothetical protein [Acaryochloris sp. SU_5_25]
MRQFITGFVFFLTGIIAAACQPSSPPTTQSPTPTTSTKPEASVKAGFNSELYLIDNPDVPDLIKSGKFKSALDHYEKAGKFGKNAKGKRYETTFTGTSGNDTVQGLGPAEHTHFIGVGYIVDPAKGGDYPVLNTSLGEGEVDTLIGNTEGENEFILGSYITSAVPKAEPFYVGKGDADYARIKNFTRKKDSLYLSGLPEQYKIESAKGMVKIFTKEGDLVVIVEGVDKLAFGELSKEYGQFAVK